MRIFIAGVIATLALVLAGCPQKHDKATGSATEPAMEQPAAPAAPMESAPAATEGATTAPAQ